MILGMRWRLQDDVELQEQQQTSCMHAALGSWPPPSLLTDMNKCNTTNPDRSFLTRHILSSVRKSSAVCHWYKTPNQHTRIRSWLKPGTSWPSDHCRERTALVGGQPGTIKLIFHFNLLSLTSGQKEERGGKVVSHRYHHCYFLELRVFCVQSAGLRPLLHFSVFSCVIWGNG